MINAVQQALAVLSQPLLGKLVDVSKWKRSFIGLGSLFMAACTAVTVLMPHDYWLQLVIQAPMAVGLVLVPLALNSLTLGTATAASFTQQIALNNAGQHAGLVLSSAAMALCSLYGPKVSVQEHGEMKQVASPVWCMVPSVTALLAVAALGIVRFSKIDHQQAAGLGSLEIGPSSEAGGRAEAQGLPLQMPAFWLSLLLAFLFNFANMAQLQLLVQEAASLLPSTQVIPYTSLAQIVAHFGMMCTAVLAGRAADRIGRKPLLLVACFTVTFRALVTAMTIFWWIQRGGTPWLGLLPCEGLDGVDAGLWGVLVVLVARDISEGTGCFGLVLSCLQAAFGAGGIASSVVAGVMADRYGFASAFLPLAAAGVAASIVAGFIPETAGTGSSKTQTSHSPRI